MGRFHSDFIDANHGVFLKHLNDLDWTHIIYGLKTENPNKLNLNLSLKFVSQTHSSNVRKQAARLFKILKKPDYCRRLLPFLKLETQPEVLEEWMGVLDLDTCPELIAWTRSLFNIDHIPLQQSILVTWSMYDFPERTSCISEYLTYPNPDIQATAKSILAQLKNKKTLTLTPQIVSLTPQSNRFLKGVQDGNLNEIKEAINAGADPNTTISEQWNLLMLIASPQYSSLYSKTQVNAAHLSDLGNFDAFTERILELTRFLLNHGADPNLQDPFGRTPLFLAVMSK